MLASVSVVPRASFRHSCSMNSPSKALRNMLAQTRSNGSRATRRKRTRSDIWNPFAIPMSRLPRSGIGKHTCAGKEYRTRHARRQRRPALPHIVRGQEPETNGERPCSPPYSDSRKSACPPALAKTGQLTLPCPGTVAAKPQHGKALSSPSAPRGWIIFGEHTRAHSPERRRSRLDTTRGAHLANAL